MSLNMQRKSFSIRKAAVALYIVLLMLAQEVHAGPLTSDVQSSSDQGADSRGEHTLRRIARMTPLWRIISSKPLGAYCQNNYECSTGICKAGHCSTRQHSSESVNH
ncbi:liver-expressed antimicrobial peptide 2 [Mastacembelus armatus]|uniref:Liver-expressed antimicrobial peptide 2 n=1 Tax=Mastacembelus armatus TaxID=205130 RepID=A0A3Q3LNT6_9TELE|nr:liver-expressed antimicrobial peptide 2-like [Mastacembelus armatus]